MLKDFNGKVVRNKILFDQPEDYIKPDKVKSKIKSKPVDSAHQSGHNNKLAPMQNYVKPQHLQLVGYQQDSSQGDKQQNLQNQSDQLAQKIRRIQKKEYQQYKQNRRVIVNQNQNTTEKQNNNQKSVEFLNQSKFSTNKNNNILYQKKPDPLKQIKNGAQSLQKPNFAKKRSPQDRKKLFNIQLSDSSSAQQKHIQKKRTQNEIEKQIQGIVSKQMCYDTDQQNKAKIQINVNSGQKLANASNLQNKQEMNEQYDSLGMSNVFQGLKQSKKSNKSKFHFQFSESSQQQEIKKQAIITPRKVEKRKIILESMNTEQDQEDDDDKNEQQEYLQIVRNMNYQKLKNHFQLVKSDINFIAFCPIPAEHKISLIIKRDTTNSVYTVFDNQLVCQIMKVQKKIGGNYKFMMVKDAKDSKSQEKQVGKMKSNFLGTQFHCYTTKNQNNDKQKYQCISIKYDVNILGLNGPRKTKIYSVTKPLPSEVNLLQTYQKNKSKNEIGIKVYQNKTPKWLPQLNAYVLNLRGTATHSSIKNCIIVDSTNENKEHLIFGKKAKDIFNLQIKHPMTIIQGIAFAVSSFQRKLACE